MRGRGGEEEVRCKTVALGLVHPKRRAHGRGAPVPERPFAADPRPRPPASRSLIAAGFQKIEALEEYYGLRCLWLEGNGLSKLENLEALTELRGLYCQQNCIKVIEGLGQQKFLDTLNVSNNMITMISGLGELARGHLDRSTPPHPPLARGFVARALGGTALRWVPPLLKGPMYPSSLFRPRPRAESLEKLTTLTITHNKLTDAASIRGILQCPNVSVVDMSHNELNDPEVLTVLQEMENLKVCVLTGNPIIRVTSQYRKTMITTIPKLTYLDDRPVFPKERACAEAFMAGGRDAERAARQEFMQKEKDKQARGVQHLMDIQARARAERLAGDGDADRTDSEAELSDVETDEDDAAQKPSYSVVDQMNYHSQTTGVENWEPAEEQRAVDMETITGPKAADIDLFGSDSEFEDVDDDDYKNTAASASAPASAAGGEPLFTVSSTTRKAAAAPKMKMKIEEIEDDEDDTKNATAVPAAVASGAVCRNAFNEFHDCSAFCREHMASQAEAQGAGEADEGSDLDEIEEDIVRPKSKWESVGDGGAGSPARSPVKMTSFVTEVDDSVPDLEEVNMATGAVTNRITIVEDASVSAPPKSGKLIEMIGGDDMDGLD